MNWIVRTIIDGVLRHRRNGDRVVQTKRDSKVDEEKERRCNFWVIIF